MSTFYGNFKTAYLQREVANNAIVIGDLHVGEMVEIEPATDKLPAIISKLEATTVAGAQEEASHIMAQSDMTLGYGHVPVENRDYRYSDKIASSIDEDKVAPAAGKTGAEFLGIYESDDDLPTTASAVTDGDTALVLDDSGIKLEKYAASVVSTTVSWTKATSTAAYEISLLAATKQTAEFKIINIDDVNVVEVTE